MRLQSFNNTNTCSVQGARVRVLIYFKWMFTSFQSGHVVEDNRRLQPDISGQEVKGKHGAFRFISKVLSSRRMCVLPKTWFLSLKPHCPFTPLTAAITIVLPVSYCDVPPEGPTCALLWKMFTRYGSHEKKKPFQASLQCGCSPSYHVLKRTSWCVNLYQLLHLHISPHILLCYCY